MRLSTICVLLATMASTCFCVLYDEASISHSGSSSPRRKRSTSSRGTAFYTHNFRIERMVPSKTQQDFLLSEHNKFRSKVPATNMRYMFWSKRLAATAQRHADRCDFRHSRDRIRTGENIWAAPYSDYSRAVFMWYDEVNLAYCRCPHAYKHCCGHYTQVVWASTYLVGCGAAQCLDLWGVRGQGHHYILVCHYSPQGNVLVSTPRGTTARLAFNFQNATHKACSTCPKGLDNCYQGLCW